MLTFNSLAVASLFGTNYILKTQKVKHKTPNDISLISGFWEIYDLKSVFQRVLQSSKRLIANKTLPIKISKSQV